MIIRLTIFQTVSKNLKKYMKTNLYNSCLPHVPHVDGALEPRRDARGVSQDMHWRL